VREPFLPRFVVLAAGRDAFDRLRAAASGVPGWIEQKERYRSFTTEEFYAVIDGGRRSTTGRGSGAASTFH